MKMEELTRVGNLSGVGWRGWQEKEEKAVQSDVCKGQILSTSINWVLTLYEASC